MWQLLPAQLASKMACTLASCGAAGVRMLLARSPVVNCRPSVGPEHPASDATLFVTVTV